MTEEELVDRFAKLVAGERAFVQRSARTCRNRRALEGAIYGTRHLFRMVHPEADKLVDAWIMEAIRG
jgi:hypothetical protein